MPWPAPATPIVPVQSFAATFSKECRSDTCTRCTSGRCFDVNFQLCASKEIVNVFKDIFKQKSLSQILMFATSAALGQQNGEPRCGEISTKSLLPEVTMAPSCDNNALAEEGFAEKVTRQAVKKEDNCVPKGIVGDQAFFTNQFKLMSYYKFSQVAMGLCTPACILAEDSLAEWSKALAQGVALSKPLALQTQTMVARVHPECENLDHAVKCLEGRARDCWTDEQATMDSGVAGNETSSSDVVREFKVKVLAFFLVIAQCISSSRPAKKDDKDHWLEKVAGQGLTKNQITWATLNEPLEDSVGAGPVVGYSRFLSAPENAETEPHPTETEQLGRAPPS
ncbi:hypothetical protein AK812_SmicGene15998 [Symbiodinium microadriaticum]|uniref:Uncharacterized protein n=1 Tax=Symbiodinium microadriaticum TaxID=2951 RepID=A0A1Q9E1H1_SYMMI|nr:hypothetical protein AK812_SmicGene15998 [Symbiodinium microadriaticum]